MSEPRRPCVVEDGRFVRGCTALDETVSSVNGARIGVTLWNMVNMKTAKPSRTFYGVRSGDHAKKGLAFNFCPFCGTGISAPFHEQTEEPTP